MPKIIAAHPATLMSDAPTLPHRPAQTTITTTSAATAATTLKRCGIRRMLPSRWLRALAAQCRPRGFQIGDEMRRSRDAAPLRPVHAAATRDAPSRSPAAPSATALPAAVAGHPERTAEQRLCRGRAERNDESGFSARDLGFEPRKTGGDFHRAGLAVDPPCAARHPFEMLDGIGDVGLAAVDPGLDETAVEQLAGGADKRMAGEVLGVARLLADKHDARPLRPLAEHGLRRVLV